MWSSKKQDKPPPADPGLKNVQTNQSPKPVPASWERTTKPSKDALHATEATSVHAPSRLGSSLHLIGEISGNEDLDIDGTVEGLVHIDERKLTVGATARLAADIIAGEVIVHGIVRGNVRAKGKVEIKKDGSVNGDLTTPQIIIEDGAYFKGSIEIEKSGEEERDEDAVSRKAPAPATPAEEAGPRDI